MTQAMMLTPSSASMDAQTCCFSIFIIVSSSIRQRARFQEAIMNESFPARWIVHTLSFRPIFLMTRISEDHRELFLMKLKTILKIAMRMWYVLVESVVTT